MEQKVAVVPSSCGEERQFFIPERYNAIARTTTLRRELDSPIAQRGTMEDRTVELTRELQRSRPIRLDIANTDNADKRSRELTEINNGIAWKCRNTA